MNNYLAKSNPKETIQMHTDNLLKNYKILKEVYPNLNLNWDILKLACLYHDLGKMNLKFQSKIEKGKKYENEIAHNLLSLAFLDTSELKKQFMENEIKILAQAIAYHHDRGDYCVENYNDEVELLKKEAEKFKYNKVAITRIKKISSKYFSNDRIYGDQKDFFDYVKIKGLLNRLDYAASSYIPVEIRNDFLLKGLQNLNYKWNDLQKFMIQNQNHNVVIIAETGIGKTEAGLLWIGDNKGFFTLPLKTAINEIYKRIINNIVDKDSRHLVGLLHSDTYSKYIENKLEDEDIEQHYNQTKQLSLPLTVCTLDQLFDFVFRYRDFEVKLATLSYSKVVIDEVQMYSDDLLAYLILGLSYITRIGGKFAILTATLPNIVIDLLESEKIPFAKPKKDFINNNDIRHSAKIEHSIIKADAIAEKYHNNKILVICNTVKKAQKIYEELLSMKICENINLFHGKFIKKDRKEKEKAIMNFAQNSNKGAGIWVTTQVVEASLDIDFDLLFTELSDINGIFQRMGRCYRKRNFNQKGYNCYIFDGGDKICSGVGRIIDKEIFEFSKEALKFVDGKITESQKLDLINEVYTTQNLKSTQYYKKVIGNIQYIKSLNEYELNKKEVQKRFRNIDNITVIPKSVYDVNKEIIKWNIEILNKKTEKYEDKQKLREEKTRARNEINDFTVEISYNEAKNIICNKIKLSKYETIAILDCEYSKEKGIYIEKDKKYTENIKEETSNII